MWQPEFLARDVALDGFGLLVASRGKFLVNGFQTVWRGLKVRMNFEHQHWMMRLENPGHALDHEYFGAFNIHFDERGLQTKICRHLIQPHCWLVSGLTGSAHHSRMKPFTHRKSK